MDSLFSYSMCFTASRLSLAADDRNLTNHSMWQLSVVLIDLLLILPSCEEIISFALSACLHIDRVYALALKGTTKNGCIPLQNDLVTSVFLFGVLKSAMYLNGKVFWCSWCCADTYRSMQSQWNRQRNGCFTCVHVSTTIQTRPLFISS